MWPNTNWRWVREWVGRIFFAAFCLSVFGALTALPVLRPGGVMAALPSALLIGLAIAVPLTAIAGGALAHYSDRKGGRHES